MTPKLVSDAEGPDERVLTASVIDGSEAAFRELYRRHTPRLRLLVRRILAGTDDEEARFGFASGAYHVYTSEGALPVRLYLRQPSPEAPALAERARRTRWKTKLPIPG